MKKLLALTLILIMAAPSVTYAVDLTMFHSSVGGIGVSEDVDLGDNYIVNVAKQLAGIDKLTIESPPYADTAERFNLLMASGKLPDIVFTYPGTDITKYAKQGAFIDLKTYYDASENIKRRIPERDYYNFSKDPDSDHWYYLPPTNTFADGTMLTKGAVLVRKDLVEKYNGGKYPETIDEYTEFFRAIKADDPEALPYADRLQNKLPFNYNGEAVFMWHGLTAYGSIAYEGKWQKCFTLPGYLDALNILKQYYEEGFIQQDFATNGDVFWIALDSKLAVVTWEPMNVFSQTERMALATDSMIEGINDNRLVVAPPLKEYPASLTNIAYTVPYMTLSTNWQGLGVTAMSKNPDAAFKYLDALASDEMFDAIYWREEGVDHVVVDGVKQIVPENYNMRERAWAPYYYGYFFGFASPSTYIKFSFDENLLGKETFGIMKESFYSASELSKELRGYSSELFMPEDVNGVINKLDEANTFIAEVVVNYVMGNIGVEEYQAKVDEYKSLYGYMDDAYTEILNSNKELYRSYGAKDVDF
jgi:ABC-type glycerol-3-phosphate transport system substrate-binding protein